MTLDTAPRLINKPLFQTTLAVQRFGQPPYSETDFLVGLSGAFYPGASRPLAAGR